MFDKITDLLLNKKYIDYYPLVSGVVMAVSFTIPSLWFLGFFGMVPLFAFLYQKNLSFGKVFINGLSFGFIFIGGVLSWLWSAYPLEWAGVENDFVALFSLFAVWLISSIFFSLFIAAWTVTFCKFRKNNFWDILFASSLWIIFEYLRAFAATLLWISPVSLLGPHATFGFLGYILAENTLLLSLASIGGIYLLGFIVTLMNIYIYQMLSIKITTGASGKKFIYILSSFVLVFTVSFLAHTFSNGVGGDKKLRIAIIDTYFPTSSGFDKKIYSEHAENIKRLIVGIKNKEHKPDIIILPEDSRFISSLSNAEKELIDKNILQKETLFIDSSDSLNLNGDITFRLEYFNTKNGSKYSHKALLVPFGEYLPYTALFILRALGEYQLIEDFNDKRGYSNSKNLNNAITEFQDIKIGALFCSEIVSSKLYETVTKQGANLLINIASHSVFRDVPILYFQTVKMAKIHAVQNNRYFIQSINFAPSFVVDNKGEIIVKSKNTNYGVTYGDVVSHSKASIYNKLGNWVLFVSLMIAMVGMRKYLYKLKAPLSTDI